MSHINNDLLTEGRIEERRIWLLQNLSNEEDVREDDNGEFIFWTEYSGDDDRGAREKIYLPEQLTTKGIINFVGIEEV